MRKRGKQPISRIQRKLWELCKQIIRKRYGNSCYTCGTTGLAGSNWQTGHLWAKASLGAYMKYDLRILRPQCAVCNLWRGGMGADFYRRMEKEKGKEYMQQLERDRRKTTKAYDHYARILEQYQTILKKAEASIL